MGKRRRPGFRLICLLVLAGLLGTACARAPAGPPAEIPSPEALPDGVVTLRILTLGADSTLDAVINEFYAKYPRHRISKQYLPWSGQDPTEQMAEAIRRGEVDLVQTDGYGKELAEQGLMLPLSPLIRQTGFDIGPLGPMPALAVSGELYDLPTTFQPQVLVYNPVLFEAAGVPVPPRTGWTWEQFRETARILSRGEGAGRTWGFSAPLAEELVLAYLHDRAGPTLEDLRPEHVRAALTFFGAMVHQDQSMPPAERRRWDRRAPFLLTDDDFSLGKAAMGLANLPLSRPFKGPWEVAALPTTVGRPQPVLAAARTYGIAANSRQQGAAWEFLRFIAGGEGAVIAARNGQPHVYVTPAASRAWAEQNPAPPRSTWLFLAHCCTVVRRGSGEGGTDQTRWVLDAANQVLSGTASADMALVEYVNRMASRPPRP